jgi:hypothetical protein
MALEQDIVERLRRDFVDAADDAIEILGDSGIEGRTARCVVFTANGSIAALRAAIEVAEFDYRDAIIAGEYAKNGNRVRDFSVSFLVDSPVHMWVSEVARVLYRRGMQLTSVESHSASPGGFS